MRMTRAQFNVGSLTLSDWNWGVLMLQQALIGAVSPNFRMVELGFESGVWVVRVTLRAEDEADREEVEDVCDAMGDFLEDIRERISDAAYAKVIPSIRISTETIFLRPESVPRIVFRARD